MKMRASASMIFQKKVSSPKMINNINNEIPLQTVAQPNGMSARVEEESWFLMKRRLQELDFVVSPSQLETPRDGNCMFHSIYDQLQYNAALRTFCGSQQELRVEVVNRGFTSFLSTGRLTWPGDPQLGTPDTWR